MKIFVTGGTGRLGAYVVPLLRSAGHDVYVLTRRSTNDVKHIQGDLFNLDYKQLEGFDWIVHMAGSVKFGDPNMYYTNTEGTRAMVERAEDAGVNGFLYMSSISVYGKNVRGPITEKSPVNPDTEYAKSKFDGELMANRFRGNLIVLRPGMIFGKKFYEGFRTAYRMIQSGKMVYVGNGNNRIPLVYAGDVAESVLWTIEHKLYDTFNVVNPELMTQRELIDFVAGFIGSNPPKYSIPFTLLLYTVKFLNKIGYSKIHSEFIEMIGRDRPIISNKLIETGFKFTNLKEKLSLFLRNLSQSL